MRSGDSPAAPVAGGRAAVRSGVRSRARGLARRLAGAMSLATVLLAGTAAPASAHAVGGASPSNFRVEIHSVTPQVPGVTVRVVDAGARLEVVNTSGREVQILGYNNEPYLRIGPNGVEENTRSPATYLNRSLDLSNTPPPEANPEAPPEWRKVSDGNRVAWHDHRMHWMDPDEDPPQVQRDPGAEHVVFPEWKVELRQDGQPITVTGDMRWVPGPSATPWLVLAGALALLLFLTARTPILYQALAISLALLVVVDIAHTVSVWMALSTAVPVKLYGSILPLAAWIVAGIAIFRLRGPNRESGTFYALFAAALALVSAISDLSALSSSQLVGSLPDWATRTAVALRIGLAAGIVLAGLIGMRRTLTPAPGTGTPAGSTPAGGPPAGSEAAGNTSAGNTSAGGAAAGGTAAGPSGSAHPAGPSRAGRASTNPAKPSADPSGERPASPGQAVTCAALALAVAGSLLLAAAPPAAAHDTKVLLKADAKVTSRARGAVEVTAVATYPDGHRAGGVTVKAVASKGRDRVPVTLRAARRGIYRGTAELDPGAWTINLTASGRAKGQARTRVTVPPPAPATTRPPATAPPATTAPAGGAPTDTTALRAADASATQQVAIDPATVAGALGIAGLVALAAWVILFRRARRG